MAKKVVKGIKLTMDEELLRKYEEIKKYLGVQADAEVVRILINQFYREVVEPSKRKVVVSD